MSHRVQLGLGFFYAGAKHCKSLGSLTDSDATVSMEGLAVFEAFTYVISRYNIKESPHTFWQLIF